MKYTLNEPPNAKLSNEWWSEEENFVRDLRQAFKLVQLIDLYNPDVHIEQKKVLSTAGQIFYPKSLKQRGPKLKRTTMQNEEKSRLLPQAKKPVDTASSNYIRQNIIRKDQKG